MDNSSVCCLFALLIKGFGQTRYLEETTGWKFSHWPRPQVPTQQPAATLFDLVLVDSPVQVVDQALLVQAPQPAQQLLVLPVQIQVIGHGEGLQGVTGERLHLLVAVQV